MSGKAALHPRTREILELLDEQRVRLREAVEAVPAALRGRRPVADRWSVAEVLEHLATVEARVTTQLGRMLHEGKARGLGPERESSTVIPRRDLELLTDRTRKRVASEASQPKGTTNADAAWEALQLTRASLRATVLAGDGLDVGTLVAPHPAFGPIDWYRWLVFVGGHEARHAAQIREIAESAGA